MQNRRDHFNIVINHEHSLSIEWKYRSVKCLTIELEKITLVGEKIVLWSKITRVFLSMRNTITSWYLINVVIEFLSYFFLLYLYCYVMSSLWYITNETYKPFWLLLWLWNCDCNYFCNYLIAYEKKIVNIFKLNKNFEIKILIKIKNFFKFKIFYNRKK